MSDIEILPVEGDTPPPVRHSSRDTVSSLSQRLRASCTDHGYPAHEAIEDLIREICLIANVFERNAAIDDVAKAWKVAKKLVADAVKSKLQEQELELKSESDEGIAGNFPDFAMARTKELFEVGFIAHVDPKRLRETGIWFYKGGTALEQVSNFTLKPLYHIQSATDDKRIIEINNGRKIHVVDLPSRAMISVEMLSGALYEKGNYLFFGSKVHLHKILDHIGDHFGEAKELVTLGWQPAGFFAYSNGIVRPATGAFEQMDEMGMVSVDGVNYFSPSISEIYNHIQGGDDDEYENDRYLKHGSLPRLDDGTVLNFGSWAEMMQRVYGAAGQISVGYVLVAAFKDIVFKLDNNCPHLSFYGEPGSGKSKCAESNAALFFNSKLPFNLNYGTDFAFANSLKRFRNCIVWLDEFDDGKIKEERFQAIKGAYDGAGRERGRGGSKNKSEMSKVNSALLLTGQTLSTHDNNAALTRCISVAFSKVSAADRDPEQVKLYDQLKRMEKEGISALLVEVVAQRAHVEQHYYTTFAQIAAELSRELRTHAVQERILRNYTALATMVEILGNKLRLPFTNETFRGLIKEHIIKLSRLIAESDALRGFWNTIQKLFETGHITEGLLFRIVTVQEITIRDKDSGSDKKITFEQPTKLLLLRLTTLHGLYMEECRRATGKNGIDLNSMILYFNTAKGYVGQSKGQKFGKGEQEITTSCYIFRYEELDIALDTAGSSEQQQITTTIVGKVVRGVEHKLIGTVPTLEVNLVTVSTTQLMGKDFTEKKWYKLYDTNLEHESLYLTDQYLSVSGVLSEKVWTSKTDGKRNVLLTMQVTTLAPATDQPEDETKVNDDDLPF